MTTQARERPRHVHRKRFTRHTPAGEVVLAYLNAQAARLGELELAVRQEQPDAVHQMRVTVRRLRSTLQSYRRIVAGPAARHLRGELKWLGGVLGAARDIGVHAHLAGENAFSFGLLEDRAYHQALASEERASRAWRRACRKAGWLPKS